MDNKIIILIHSLYGEGGAEKVCISIANGLIKNNFNVTLLSLDILGAFNFYKLNPDVKCDLLYKKHTLLVFFLLFRWLLIHKPKKILVFNYKLAIMLIILRFLTQMQFCIISRNMNILSIKIKGSKSFWHKYIVHNIIYFLYKHVDSVIAQSQGMKDDLSNNYNIPNEKIFVINNPIQSKIETFVSGNEILNKKNGNYILCVGRLVSQKAFNYAIEAFSRIFNNYPNLRLKILGVGKLETNLKQLVYDLNIADKVDFEGYCQDIIPYYINANITVLTSLYEGLPNVLIESIALGTPVVSFDCPHGPSEIIQDGINGYLTKYKDAEHLTECIRLALDSKWDSALIQATANKFLLKNIIDEYVKVLLKS